jgi:DNA mismatch repair protein MutH
MNDKFLLQKAKELEGLTFLQLARLLDLRLPQDLIHAKGWLGQAIEQFLGASAGSKAMPDFPLLGIELKTIPVSIKFRVIESTYVTSLNLMPNSPLVWEESVCYQKLQKVLWLPIEGEKNIAFQNRRIGAALLWQPSNAQFHQLKTDWSAIMDLVLDGRIEELDGRLGQYLHIRPKAANAKVSTLAVGHDLELIRTLPRGFYLRSSFTQSILEQAK